MVWCIKSKKVCEHSIIFKSTKCSQKSFRVAALDLLAIISMPQWSQIHGPYSLSIASFPYSCQGGCPLQQSLVPLESKSFTTVSPGFLMSLFSLCTEYLQTTLLTLFSSVISQSNNNHLVNPASHFFHTHMDTAEQSSDEPGGGKMGNKRGSRKSFEQI